MPVPWLKICGLRQPAEVELALALGARYVGAIVEVPGSPRSVSLPEARALSAVAQGRLVAVVRDLPPDRLRQILEELSPAAVQLHGAEPPEAVSHAVQAHPEQAWWKAVGLSPAMRSAGEMAAVAREIAEYAGAGAAGVVLDTRHGGQFGGSGSACDWAAAAELVQVSPLPLVLAGGLSAENLREAVEQVGPAGLDVSSSLEDRPGVKSPPRMRALFAVWRSLAGEPAGGKPA